MTDGWWKRYGRVVAHCGVEFSDSVGRSDLLAAYGREMVWLSA